MVDSCWRVCRASMLAPSSLVSARTRLSAPVCSVLIIDFVKSLRACTTESCEPNEEGANMLALQTRQQLSTTALSLANQASQAVLRLFG